MKKAIVSPLCSAFVIPGLGQIINQQLKKGLLILGTVFVLLVVFTVRLIQVIRAVLNSVNFALSDSSMMLEEIKTQDPLIFYIVLAAFFTLWAYSVIDALVVGLNQDRKGNSP